MRNRQDEQVILDAALKVFSRYGYKKSTLEDIANELNMTNTAIAFHPNLSSFGGVVPCGIIGLQLCPIKIDARERRVHFRRTI